MTDKLSKTLGSRQWRYDHVSMSRDEWDELVALEQRVERLRMVADEAERISIEAHLAADSYAYDLMRTVLRPLVGNMEMSVEEALSQEEG